MYYDKQGKSIGKDEWVKLFDDLNYGTVVRYEDERVLISTIWLGLNHNWTEGLPLIFETMIFFHEDKKKSREWSEKFMAARRRGQQALGEPHPESVNPLDQEQWRWFTESEAKEGHEIIVACYKENLDPWEAIRKWRESPRLHTDGLEK